MKILVILAHPDKSSFSHAIAGTAVRALEENGHEVIYHDLYAERFSSTLTTAEIFKNSAVPRPVGKHCAELAAAEGIIIVHPNWWGQPPAILKGYIDRVFRPGVAYEFAEGDDGEGIPIGLLKATAALVFNTSNTELEREKEVFGDPLQSIWKKCVFDLCGVKTFPAYPLTVCTQVCYSISNGGSHKWTNILYHSSINSSLMITLALNGL